MPLSRQVQTRANLVKLGHDITALHPGFYILQCAPWQTPSPGYHRSGSWHIYPTRAAGLAMDVNWKNPATGAMNNEEEHRWLAKAAILALQRGFSITYPLTPDDNARGTVANHSGNMLHLHIDCGSYSNIGTRTPAKGGAVTTAIKASALGYLVAYAGTVTPTANPGGAKIQRGDRGGEVEGLQHFLNARPHVSGTLKVDKVFGPSTERAVKQWQRNNHLTPDGIVGPKSKKKMTAQALAYLLSHKGKIRRGDRGAAVLYLQVYLNSRPHTRPWLVTDEVFGNATEQALKKFQTNNHLAPDAVWGPDCRAKAKRLK